MNLLNFIILSLLLITMIQVSYGQEPRCESGVTFTCQLSQLGIESVALFQEETRLKAVYNTFASTASPNFTAEIEQYVFRLNNLRQCQRQLQQTQKSCSLNLTEVSTIGPGITKRAEIGHLEQYDGECHIGPNIESYSIQNAQGEDILSVLNGRYMTKISPTCTVQDNVTNSTTRSVVFSAYSPERPSIAGVFQMLDWASDDDDFDYKVSQQWARRISLGSRTSMNFTIENGQLVFSYSNGARFVIDGQSGMIVESNFFDIRNAQSGECHTNVQMRSGAGEIKARARFFPQVDLLPAFRRLSVTTVRS